MKRNVGEILGLVFVLAVIALLVRPNSLGPNFVRAAGDGLSAVISFAVSS
jgi:hypothetical protein